MAVSPDDPHEFGSDDPSDGWNVESEDLAFLRDEGLELLALFKSIRDERKRRLVVDLIRVVAGESPGR